MLVSTVRNRLSKTDVLGPGPGVEFTRVDVSMVYRSGYGSGCLEESLPVHGVDLPSSSAVVLVDGNEAVDTLDEETSWGNGGGPSESDVGAGDGIDADDVEWDLGLCTLASLEGSLAGEGDGIKRISTEHVDAVGGIGEVVAQVSVGNGISVVGDQRGELGDEVTGSNVGQANGSC